MIVIRKEAAYLCTATIIRRTDALAPFLIRKRRNHKPIRISKTRALLLRSLVRPSSRMCESVTLRPFCYSSRCFTLSFGQCDLSFPQSQTKYSVGARRCTSLVELRRSVHQLHLSSSARTVPCKITRFWKAVMCRSEYERYEPFESGQGRRRVIHAIGTLMVYESYSTESR